uniref:Uncharacterized protein n=1 Tax=Anopheles funestus TaxID=62324 RepID=A0A182RBZ1_ANOFN
MFHESWIFSSWIVVLLAQQGLAVETSPKSVSIPSVCLNGAYDNVGNCVCNPGFSEYKGNCFLTSVSSPCPSGSILWNGKCQPKALPPMQDIIPAKHTYVVVPPLRVSLLSPNQTDPLDPAFTEEAASDDEEGEEDHVYMPPVRDHYFNVSYQKIVNNHNVINNDTTHNTHNVNNVVVHLTRKKPNGVIKTVVIRNNETTVYEEEPSEKHSTKTDVSKKEDCPEEPTTTQAPIENVTCCTIVSPRVCRKQTDEWVCFHRKQYVCSKFCTAKIMYLRPREPRYRDPWLIMPPMKNPFARLNLCHSGVCPRPDCSGCLRGRSQCHPMCYTYDCMQDDSCHYIDQKLICNDKPMQVCALLDDEAIQPPQNQTKPIE